jgi:AcrR family transcriptional regulator
MSKEEKRKLLLQAASDVLMEYGVHKTTLDDIAQRAGMVKTSLYYYFRDKNEIVRAFIESEMDSLFQMMVRAADSVDTAEDKMYAIIETRYRFIADRSARTSKEIIRGFKTMEGIFESVRESYLQSHKELIRGILEGGIRRGEIKPIEDLDLVALIMIASLFGCDNTFAFYDQHERVLEALKRMVKIFFTGLKNVP